ncbi:HEAT repeat domain-containing protein [Salisediminibacterium halotolerans]|uniref:HEAT repeat-containing protein n=1 Tax=Salisediminibacterium halotolerans TaxID=517425 RepID=A0A1H9W7Y7_9BACI|nr:hypothetical protein [Salisediminibacterium haloalkalitolerans]SES30032.1 hypothetical protein SAMN05444126_12918 [Salisediminibacterium haloalkalitolerans]
MTIELAVWTVMVLLVIQTGLLVSMTISKWRLIGKSQRLAKNRAELLPDFMDYISNETTYLPRLPANRHVRRDVTEWILEELSDRTSNEQERNRITQAAEELLAADYEQVLNRGDWSARVNALYLIEDFRMGSLRDAVYARYQIVMNHDDEETRQCLRTMAALQDDRAVAEICARTDLSVQLIKDLLNRVQEDQLAACLTEERLERLPEKTLATVLAYYGETGATRFLPTVEKYLTDARKEVRLKALKSLVDYQYISDPKKLAPFFDSDYWEERMYAAKVTGAAIINEHADKVTSLMEDPVWWVRYAAAEAVKSLDHGQETLNEIAAASTDPFARDMANRMLTMKG